MFDLFDSQTKSTSRNNTQLFLLLGFSFLTGLSLTQVVRVDGREEEVVIVRGES